MELLAWLLHFTFSLNVFFYFYEECPSVAAVLNL